MIKTRLYYKILSIIIIINAMVFFFIKMMLNNSSQYCPIKHKLSKNWNCEILDNDSTKILIQHENLKNKELYLSIYKDKKHKWIKHPFMIDNYKVLRMPIYMEFDSMSCDSILYYGFKFPILRTDEVRGIYQ